MRKNRRKKNEESKRRFEAIKDLMSTFAMSTVVVVAVVTLIPASPKAEIMKVVSLSEEVVYQVNVTDEDNALDLSTLTVVLENQLEYYEQHVSLGEQSGFFKSLKSNTEYRLSVYGNKGFGQERLDTRMVTTQDRVGGTILSVENVSLDFSTSYLVDVSVNDPEMKYTSVILYYGFSFHPGEDIVYSSMDITSSLETVELIDIFAEDNFHIYLEGTTTEGKELLDEIWVTPPFNLYASLYKSYTSNNEVGYFLYSDVSVENVSYKMNIYKNDVFMRSDSIEIGESTHGDIEFTIRNLQPNTTYLFEFIVTFTNPNTLRLEEKVIYEEETTTLDGYTYTYTTEIIDEYMEVTLVVNDPNHYFQQAYYESYDTSGEFDSWLANEIYFFIPIGEDKTTTFTIYIPVSTSYRITIGLQNELDNSIKQIVDIIIVE